MHIPRWLVSFAIAGVGIYSLPSLAMAEPHELQPASLSMADALTPQRQSQDSLNRLANEMGLHTGRQDTSGEFDLATSLNIPLLNDLIDASGEVRLPMGLTFFDAMGTTSVGFGSKF